MGPTAVTSGPAKDAFELGLFAATQLASTRRFVCLGVDDGTQMVGVRGTKKT